MVPIALNYVERPVNTWVQSLGVLFASYLEVFALLGRRILDGKPGGKEFAARH